MGVGFFYSPSIPGEGTIERKQVACPRWCECTQCPRLTASHRSGDSGFLPRQRAGDGKRVLSSRIKVCGRRRCYKRQPENLFCLQPRAEDCLDCGGAECFGQEKEGTELQTNFPFKRKNNTSSLPTSEYIRLVNPGCRLFVGSQLKPL